MRTIKFKAKRKGKGQWVSGDLTHSLDGNLNILGFVEEEGKIGFTGAHQIDPDTLCQLTGFHDKHGKEIYEGDVLRSDEYPYNYHGKDNYFAEVYWSEYSCGVDLRIQKSPQTDVHGDYAGIRESLTLNFARTFEVIGNIHDKEWQEKLNLKK